MLSVPLNLPRPLWALLLAITATTVAWAEEPLIVLRQFDEVVTRNGEVFRGRVSESDNGEEVRVKDLRTQTVRTIKKSEIKEIRKQATLDDEITRLAAEFKGKPDRVLQLAQQIITNFDTRTDRALAILENEAASKNPGILQTLTELYLRQGKMPQALRTAETFVSVAPGSAQAYALRGSCLLGTGQFEAAEKDLNKAVQMAPDDLSVTVARADFYLRAGKPAEARDQFDKALAKNPRNVLALVGRGTLMLRQGEFTEAEKSFNDVLQIDPRHREALLGLAATKAMTGKPEECNSLCNEVLRYYPKSGEAYGLQAYANLITGDVSLLPKFHQRLQEALKEKPNQPRLLLAWAVAIEREAKSLEATGNAAALDQAALKRAEANAKYAEVMGSEAPDAFLQFFIGERKFRANDFPGAERAFSFVTRLSPRYAPAWGALGSTSLKLGKGDAAQTAYTKAIELEGNNAEYHAGLGLALLKAKKLEEASQALGEALKRDKRNVTALCGLGYIANFSKDKDRAVQFFQDALAADGRSEFAADALRRIYQQEGMSLEYNNFDDNKMPNQWKYRAAGAIKPIAVNGQVLFSGTQGGNMGSKLELYKDIRADEFARVEADFELAPTSAVNGGLRISAGAAGTTSFELELGKDESNELKVRYRDYGGQAPVWQSLKIPWPADGRARLGLSSDDLKAGRVYLWVNGRKAGHVDLVLQKPMRITAGVFVQAPPKEVVNVITDNVVLVTRTGGPADSAQPAGLTIQDPNAPTTPAPAPENK